MCLPERQHTTRFTCPRFFLLRPLLRLFFVISARQNSDKDATSRTVTEARGQHVRDYSRSMLPTVLVPSRKLCGRLPTLASLSIRCEPPACSACSACPHQQPTHMHHCREHRLLQDALHEACSSPAGLPWDVRQGINNSRTHFSPLSPCARVGVNFPPATSGKAGSITHYGRAWGKDGQADPCDQQVTGYSLCWCMHAIRDIHRPAPGAGCLQLHREQCTDRSASDCR